MKKVLITRQIEQSVELINLLSKKGLLPFSLPLIATKAIAYSDNDISADIIIFSSENAVKFYLPICKRISSKKYIAVGEKTAGLFKTFFPNYDIHLPKKYEISSIINELKNADINQKKIIIISAKEFTEADLSPLINLGADVKRIALYETIPVIYNDYFADSFIKNNAIDTITFCSPSAVKSFMKQSLVDMNNYDIISIGKTTADYLESNGIKSRYPQVYTVKAMVQII